VVATYPTCNPPNWEVLVSRHSGQVIESVLVADSFIHKRSRTCCVEFGAIVDALHYIVNVLLVLVVVLIAVVGPFTEGCMRTGIGLKTLVIVNEKIYSYTIRADICPRDHRARTLRVLFLFLFLLLIPVYLGLDIKKT